MTNKAKNVWIWDNLYNGYVVDDQHVTHNPSEAALFSTKEYNERYQQFGRRFMSVDVREDDPNHPCFTVMSICHGELFECTETFAKDTVVIRTAKTMKTLREIDTVHTEKSLGRCWYVNFHNRDIAIYIAKNSDDAWAYAYKKALKALTSNGSRNPYQMYGYIRARREARLSTSLLMTLEQGLQCNPRHEPPRQEFQIGDHYPVEASRKKYVIRQALKDAFKKIRKYYPSGRLNEAHKTSLHDMIKVLTMADQVTVVGVTFNSPYKYTAMSPSSIMQQNAYYSYQLAFAATIDNERRVVIVD